nr:hypothetical protein [Tanacetum cinerariifolium]
MEQMTQLTSICEMTCQIVQKKLDEKQIEKEQAAKAQNRKLPRLLYDNSSPRPLEGFNSENSNAEIESFSPSPIPNEDSDSFMEEIDLFLTPDDPMPPSIKDDKNSEGDILFLERLLHDDPIPLPDTLDFS